MAAPTKNTTSCESGSGTSLAFTLPTWADGDLVLSFVGADGGRTFTAASGWTLESEDANTTRCSGAIFSRVMQSGDGNPTHTMSNSDQWCVIHVVIDAGTFDATTPVDVVTASNSWNETNASTTMTAQGVTTTQDDTLAFAIVAMDKGNTPYSPNSWTETHGSDCTNGANCGVCVAESVRTTAGATGNVTFSQNAAEDSVGGVIAIAPAAVSGVTVDVPLATFTLSGQVPTIATGAAVEVPLATFTLSDQVPTIATGAAVTVPLATFTLTSYVPTIEVGAAVNVEVPLATFTLSDQVPTIATGAVVEVPLATFTLTGHVPTIEAGLPVDIDVPLATFTLTGQVPTIATGAAVEVPAATFTLSALTPIISAGVSVTPFASVSIEDDTDIAGLMTHDNVTVVHSGTGYLGVLAETDGLALDTGTALDAWLELQLAESDITAGGIAEGDTVTIGATTYIISKIDLTGTGMAVCYLMTP